MKRLVLTLAILACFALGGVAQSLHYDFEDGTLQGWTTLDGDGDGHCWEPSIGGMGHNSNGMVLSYSRDYATGDSLAPNEYLISPRLVLNEDFSLFSLWTIPLDESQPAEHWAVSISTTVNDDPMAFTTLQEWTLTFNPFHPGEWTQYSVDLTQYAGQEVYVAIRHFFWEGFETSQSAICVDDIQIDGTIQQDGLVITPDTLTFEESGVPQTFSISNQTTNAVTISAINVQPDENVLHLWFGSLPRTLQPNESMFVQVELNEIGYKGYNNYTINIATSIGNKQVTVRVNEEAWDNGLLPWPMMGVYFTEGEPFTQTFYLYNTNALRTVIINEISEEGSNYLSMTPSHSLPWILPAGEMLEVTVTLVNFPEQATVANLLVHSSEGEINGPFFHIAGGLSPGNGDLVIEPDTLWYTLIDDQVFVMHNETSHAVTITSITNDDEEFIHVLYHDGTEYQPIEDILPIELQPNQSTQVVVRLEPMIIPPAKQRDQIISYVNIATTEGDRIVTLMINENLVNFGLVVVPYMAELYLNEPSQTFSLINAEISRPITIYGIEEENTNYLEITPQYPLPYTLQNYNDYMRCTVSFNGRRTRDWGADTYLIYHTSIGDFRSFVTIDQGLMGFPLSPEWYYEIQNDNGSITYQYMYQAGDTVVQDEPTHILVKINTLYDKDIYTDVTHEYVYERDGKIYWWNKTLEEFTVLYNFGAEVGDEWEIKVGTESLVMHVDAVEEIEYGGRTYRLLRVSDPDDLFSGDIVCGIGHLTSFFPERLMDNGDGIRVEGLRCYWVEDELVFKYGDEDCDAIYDELHGVEEDVENQFNVYPNPTNGVLFVETHGRAALPTLTYRISNLMGQIVLTGNITAENQQIDVSVLPEGMYFITVGGETQKFVVR